MKKRIAPMIQYVNADVPPRSVLVTLLIQNSDIARRTVRSNPDKMWGIVWGT